MVRQRLFEQMEMAKSYCSSFLVTIAEQSNSLYSIIDILKEILLYTSYLSMIVLAVVGIKGLKQIYVMKKSAENRSLRDSRQIAFEQTRFFARKIVLRYEKLHSIAKDKNVKMVGDLIEVEMKWEKNTGQANVTISNSKDYNEALDAMMSDILKFCNLLEEFAIPFTSRIADVKSAFKPCSASFCMYVRAFFPIISVHQRDFQQFSNVIDLFVIWDKQIETEKLKRRNVNLKKEREAVSTKIINMQTFDLNPIGINIEPERNRWFSKLRNYIKGNKKSES